MDIRTPRYNSHHPNHRPEDRQLYQIISNEIRLFGPMTVKAMAKHINDEGLINKEAVKEEDVRYAVLSNKHALKMSNDTIDVNIRPH